MLSKSMQETLDKMKATMKAAASRECETQKQKDAMEVIYWKGAFHYMSLDEIAQLLVSNNVYAPDEYRKEQDQCGVGDED